MNDRNTGRIIRELERMGFTWVSQNRHHKMKYLDGSVLTFSGSPTCGYAYKHVLRDAQKIIKRYKSLKQQPQEIENAEAV